mmetsp:Transcript_34574/g.73653  ORF Transcript_34574/g.73653 Transcript_34574/m.73653 type:complete len:498 (+) Transcript_34574:162-1655(+)|eukprot:CAMPEP_0206601656 /NCGR_PEP_ID=MMETSP0325_2-20121206/46783_1 /ASSEMBLY_ACC=CAM_ASM_000347 /TAXON_ID=2866 /ORGANISM="Crypthecodinium cohnii, Strain Seligo" /LENGTH=497 /DNA_ID=CAMNT_0054113717 /DNA_START=169 /DNA_END=1662 /DNA_ORIENTATION=+
MATAEQIPPAVQSPEDLETATLTTAAPAATQKPRRRIRAAAAVAATGVIGAAMVWAGTHQNFGIGGVEADVESAASEAALESKLRRAASTQSNPFQDRSYYVNPSFHTDLEISMAAAEPDVKATLAAMGDTPSAYWLDVKSKIRGTGTTKTMEGILQDALTKSPVPLVTFIVYDLPNRDCKAKASNGEICCTYKEDGRCDYWATGDCAAGLQEYETEYIDPIADVLFEYQNSVPIVLIIEPDSLPNLVTNSDYPPCGNPATHAAYQNGITYAVNTIGTRAPGVTMYLDAGHGGWLGWKDNMAKFVPQIRDMGIAQHLRGFATNVAGYQGLGELCPTYDYCLNHAHPEHPCCADPCGLIDDWNPSHNEVMYAKHLRHAFSSAGVFTPHVIIDTGRNGQDHMREQCKNWCNIRGAGVGHAPTTATANPDVIDAYFWLKTPGESDGCTETLPDGGLCPRFDSDCASADSIGTQASEPRAPEAGRWFDFQVQMLARNANMR